MKKHTESSTINPELIREFVDKIIVYQAEKVDGKQEQRIKIYYNCIGAIEIEPNAKMQTSWLERKVATPAGKAWVLRPRRKWTSSEEAQAMPAESVHLKWKSTVLESKTKGIAVNFTTMPIFKNLFITISTTLKL